jgi:hypothetical protein
MAKKKISLRDFALNETEDYQDGYYGGRGRKGHERMCRYVDVKSTFIDSATGNSVSIAGCDNKAFEAAILKALIAHTDWKVCYEFKLLTAFFKSRNDFENKTYLYDNLKYICNKSGGGGRHCELVYDYCKSVLKGRLPLHVEESIFPELWVHAYGSKAAYKYARYIVRGKLSKDAEKNCKSLDYVYFLRNKGLEFDDVLMGNTTISYYFYKYCFYLPEVVHNFMIASHLSGDRYAREYFKKRKKDDLLIKNRLSVVDSTKTVKEVLESLR